MFFATKTISQTSSSILSAHPHFNHAVLHMEPQSTSNASDSAAKAARNWAASMPVGVILEQVKWQVGKKLNAY